MYRDIVSNQEATLSWRLIRDIIMGVGGRGEGQGVKIIFLTNSTILKILANLVVITFKCF